MLVDKFIRDRNVILRFKSWGCGSIEYDTPNGHARIEHPLASPGFESMYETIREIMAQEQESASLLPCPLCGGRARYCVALAFMDEGSRLVKCSSCGLQTKAYKTNPEAATTWNTRSNDASKLLCNQLRKAHKEIEATNEILEERARVLKAIPECNLHGDQCVPHALEWVEKMKSVEKGLGLDLMIRCLE